MKTLPKTLCISLSFLAMACGSSKPSPDPIVSEIKKKVSDISARKGTATEMIYAGTFKETVSALEVKCRHEQATFPMPDQATVSCSQDKGILICKSEDGDGLKGFVDQDGTFGFAATIKEKGEIDGDKVDLEFAGIAEGKFSSADSAAGTAKIYLEGQIGKDKDTCSGTQSFTWTRVKEDQDDAAGTEEFAALSLKSSSAGQSVFRTFRDVRIRNTEGGLQIGAKGLSNQAILTLRDDGTADLITSERSISGCRHEQETQSNGVSVTFECDGVDGTAFLPKNSF